MSRFKVVLAFLKPFICISEYQIARYLSGRRMLKLRIPVDVFNYCVSRENLNSFLINTSNEKILDISTVEREAHRLEKFENSPNKELRVAPLGKCDETITKSMENFGHIQAQINLLEKLKQDGLQYMVPDGSFEHLNQGKIDVQKSPDLKL